MDGNERLESLSRAYGIFNRFQIAALILGSLMAGLSVIFSNDICGALYVALLFGQVIAFILFGIITMNLTDHTMKKRYPQVETRKRFSFGSGGFRYSEDLNGPMLERVRKNQDQLAEEVYTKTKRAWILCFLNVLLPILALYLTQALAGFFQGTH